MEYGGCLHESGVVQDNFGGLDYSCFQRQHSMAKCSTSGCSKRQGKEQNVKRAHGRPRKRRGGAF